MREEKEKRMREGGDSGASAALVLWPHFSDFSVSTFFCHNLFQFGYYATVVKVTHFKSTLAQRIAFSSV